ncbi:MAG: LruC domain-containing protein [Planctomycetes bacterium]|nr:LruC domain-containing protein [Planctomycetota bacterium]
MITTLALLGLGLGQPTAPAMDGNLHVPNDLVATIGDILPEGSNSGASYISEIYDPNLLITENATVDVIFIHEGAGYRNSFGYFTYAIDSQTGAVTVLDRSLIWADASLPRTGHLHRGDYVTLKDAQGQNRVFHAGERIGFFLVADGYSTEPLIQNWNALTSPIPSLVPAENDAFGLGCFTTLDFLNPERVVNNVEKSRHTAMIALEGISGFLDGEDLVVLGFEDLNRTVNSDEDFNDLVLICRSTPEEAIDRTGLFNYVSDDPDGDGVRGVDDAYPHDPERAFVQRYPSHGFLTVAVEDNYPGVGDADYNDLLISYYFTTVTASSGDTKDLIGTFFLIARGAAFDHLVGTYFEHLPSRATGVLRVERFPSNGTGLPETDPWMSIEQFVQQGRILDRIFPSTLAALPPLTGAVFTNTDSETIDRPAAASRYHFEFDDPIDLSELGSPPYDLYVGVKHGEEIWDVHFPGHAGFGARPLHLPEELAGAASFLDGNGFPFLIEVPSSWRFPLETEDIEAGYPYFADWRTSHGATHTDWYDHSTATHGILSLELPAFLPLYAWTVTLPPPE